MDGGVATWVHDDNANGKIVDASGNVETDDHVYLYMGMRRGGRDYYALDVSDRSTPKILWTITGGSGDFAELGQSWSKPIKTKVNLDGTLRDVLIFSGGYDESQDEHSVRTADSMGRAIFIIDAATGSLLWSGGPTVNGFTKDFADMKYSIPSDMRVIDVNGDGLADQMYVGDMGGQIWRFDIANGSDDDNLVSGGVIADLAGASSADNRRFYHAPDISVISEGGAKSLIIAIGSGFQAHPLSKATSNRFYAIKDSNVYQKPATYTKLTEDGTGANGLYDATDNHLGDISAVNTAAQQAAAYTAFSAASGWFIVLPRVGEKVLASSVTTNGETYFTTHEPTATSVGCTASAGTPRLFHINVSKGTPVKNYDGIGDDTELTTVDREVAKPDGSPIIHTPALPPEPQRLRIDGQDILCVGTECKAIDSAETVIKTYWLEED